MSDVFTVRADAAEGQPNPPELVVTSNLGGNGPAIFSPDGTQFAYRSRTQPGKPRLIIRALASGEERALVPEMRPFELVGWHPSGKSLVAAGTDNEARQGAPIRR